MLPILLSLTLSVPPAQPSHLEVSANNLVTQLQEFRSHVQDGMSHDDYASRLRKIKVAYNRFLQMKGSSNYPGSLNLAWAVLQYGYAPRYKVPSDYQFEVETAGQFLDMFAACVKTPSANCQQSTIKSTCMYVKTDPTINRDVCPAKLN
jgi:hypothetical protein